MRRKQRFVRMSVDLPLLLEQKQALMRAMDLSESFGPNQDTVLLCGILNLLDEIHDQLDPPELEVRRA